MFDRQSPEGIKLWAIAQAADRHDWPGFGEALIQAVLQIEAPALIAENERLRAEVATLRSVIVEAVQRK